MRIILYDRDVPFACRCHECDDRYNAMDCSSSAEDGWSFSQLQIDSQEKEVIGLCDTVKSLLLVL